MQSKALIYQHFISMHISPSPSDLPHNQNPIKNLVAKDGYLIESGEVEAANKVLVTQRLKRSGQGWGRDGGQGVLSFRALLKSDRFDRAWPMVVPRMERSKKLGSSQNSSK